MLDNWDFTKREYWGEKSPKDKRGFWLAMAGVGAFFAVMIALVWVMIMLGP